MSLQYININTQMYLQRLTAPTGFQQVDMQIDWLADFFTKQCTQEVAQKYIELMTFLKEWEVTQHYMSGLVPALELNALGLNRTPQVEVELNKYFIKRTMIYLRELHYFKPTDIALLKDSDKGVGKHSAHLMSELKKAIATTQDLQVAIKNTTNKNILCTINAYTSSYPNRQSAIPIVCSIAPSDATDICQHIRENFLDKVLTKLQSLQGEFDTAEYKLKDSAKIKTNKKILPQVELYYLYDNTRKAWLCLNQTKHSTRIMYEWGRTQNMLYAQAFALPLESVVNLNKFNIKELSQVFLSSVVNKVHHAGNNVSAPMQELEAVVMKGQLDKSLGKTEDASNTSAVATEKPAKKKNKI